MKSIQYFLLIILIFSFSNCILYLEEDFQEIEFMTPTKFSININKTAFFKYKLEEQKELIGLKFLRANLYTVRVTIYSSYEDKKQLITYSMAQNQFKEINVTNCNDYVYIVIEETNVNYHYDDYLTIYDSKRQLKLEHNKVISINNFLSNNKYELIYPSSNKSIILLYNTQNFEKNKRALSIKYENNTIIDKYETSEYKQFFNLTGNDNLIVTIENIIEKNEDIELENQEFSIIIYEVNQSDNNFNQILKNQIEIINYIYNNESQIYYFYTDISSFHNSNTFNFKLNFNYFNKNNTKIKSKIIDLDEEITQEILENNIPENDSLPSSYDDESDEYFRLYFNEITSDKKYKYLLVSIEIKDDNYYFGNRFLEVSIGDQSNFYDYSKLDLNKLEKFEMKTLNYIPLYYKLKLDPNATYLLAYDNQVNFVSTFIKGDIINSDNTVNTDFITSSLELIILSNIEEFTIKLFGPEINAIFSIEKTESSNLELKENERNNNEIFKLDMKKNEIKYILGAYRFEEYAYGTNKANYYATVDSGDFVLYYKNNITNEDTSIFPSNEKYLQKFNEIFVLKTDLDIFKILCKSNGVMYIRPQYKTFNVTTHLLEENSFNKITLATFSEVIQFSAPITKSNDILYFSILFVNYAKSITYLKNNEINLDISPDVEGAFEKKTIKFGQTFNASFDLGKYKSDELAIHLDSNAFDNEIEVVEVIKNKYTSYKEIKKGENKDISSNNILFPISSDNKTLYINIGNLKGKSISYGIIKSSINSIDYIMTADKYANSIIKEIKEDKEKIILNNTYCNQTDDIKPYIFFLLSVLNKESLKYNITIDFKDDENEGPTDNPGGDDDGDDDITKIIIIAVIITVVILILLGIILFNYVLKNKRNSSEIEKISSEPSENIIVSKYAE